MNLWLIIFIPLFTIEVFLRIVGAFQRSKAVSDKRPFGILKKDHYLLLCEGASFTRGIGAPEGYDYPSQLESLLNSNSTGKRFVVINKAVAAQNTAMILNRRFFASARSRFRAGLSSVPPLYPPSMYSSKTSQSWLLA